MQWVMQSELDLHCPQWHFNLSTGDFVRQGHSRYKVQLPGITWNIGYLRCQAPGDLSAPKWIDSALSRFKNQSISDIMLAWLSLKGKDGSPYYSSYCWPLLSS